MIPRAIFCIVLMVKMLSGCSFFSGYAPRPGDILFQDLASHRSQAIKLATGSKYTHCGVVFEVDREFVVYEAVGPVTVTPLQLWIKQGVNDHIVAKRLDTLYGYLTPKALDQMKAIGETHLGKSYDPVFGWTDEKLYCSELVWKIYYEGFGLELVPLKRLGSYSLSEPSVKEKLVELYGDSIPLEEPLVAPGDLFDSEMLYTVYQN